MNHTTTATQVRGWLVSLPELAALLPLALIAGPTRSSIHTSAPSPASRPLGNLEILSLLDTRNRWDCSKGPRGAVDPDRMGLIPHLDTWARDIAADAFELDHHIKALPDQPSLIVLVNWLLQDGLLEWGETNLDQWPEFADDMRRCYHRTLDAVQHLRPDEFQDPDVICGSCGAGRLRLVDPWGPVWECDNDACGRFASTRAVTISEAAVITGKSRRTLFAWAKEGRFTRILGDDLRPRYDLGQIRAEVARAALRTLQDGIES